MKSLYLLLNPNIPTSHYYSLLITLNTNTRLYPHCDSPLMFKYNIYKSEYVI